MKQDIILPEIKEEAIDLTHSIFVIEPLFPGYGMTIGNSLRRVLYSSLSGSAITSVMIEGVSHEFTTIDHIREDVVEILLNLKNIRFMNTAEEPITLTIDVTGAKEVKAKDFDKDSRVEVINGDSHIATIADKNGKLHLEVRVEQGMGYLPVEERKKERLPIGHIAIDAIFTPIVKISYEVENTRVGGRTDFDKLSIDIITDGTITPRAALEDASNILVDHFLKIAGRYEEEAPIAELGEISKIDDKILKLGVEEVNFSTRTMNTLINNGIKIIEDIVKLSDEELRSLKGLGTKAYDEILAKLNELGVGPKEIIDDSSQEG